MILRMTVRTREASLFSFYIALLLILLATAALLLGEVFAKDSRVVGALRDWQTYLAALVGLTAIIASLAIPSEFAKAEEAEARKNLEVAYLIDLRTRLDRFEMDARSHLALIEGVMEEGADVNSCVAALSVLSQFSFDTTIDHPDNFALQNLSPQVYFSLSQATAVQRRYARALSSLSSTDCMNNPAISIGHIFNTHQTYLPILESTKQSVQ